MKSAFIDWTEKSISLYIFEKKAGGYAPAEHSSFQLDGELDAETLRLLPAAGCDHICLSLPLDLLTLREQDFPFSDKDKITETLPFELEVILLGNVSDYLIDHVMIESFDVASKVLAACIEKTELKRIIDMFSTAGLEPKIITCLDLRLSEGKSEALLDRPADDPEVRAGAAGQEISEPTINLRQAEMSYMGDIEQAVKKLSISAALVLILVFILAGNSMLKLTSMKKEYLLLTDTLQETYRAVFPEDKKIIDIDRQFKGNMNMLMKKKAALSGVPVLDILRDIALRKNSSITLHEFSADGKNIVVKGTADTFEDVESLKNSLASGFQGVRVSESGASADKKINFTIIMREKTA